MYLYCFGIGKNSCTVLGFFSISHTPCSLQYPTKKKSIDVRSGEYGGHLMLPLLQNQCCEKTLLK